MTASREELRLMLLDGALRFANQGLTAFASGDVPSGIDGVAQCRAIVAELLTSIRPESDPELARRIQDVYSFMYRELMALGVQRDEQRLRQVIDLLEYERQTWALLMEQVEADRPPAPEPTSQTPPPPGGGATLSLEA